MYDFEIRGETKASPEKLWAVYADVAGWPRWNKAVSEAHLDGGFVSGAAGTFTVIVGVAFRTWPFHLENVEPLRRFDVVWQLGPLLSTRLTHTVERSASGSRFMHGFHAGGILAVTEFNAAWAAQAHIPGTMALIANLAEARGEGGA
jgi:hypothetical protein